MNLSIDRLGNKWFANGYGLGKYDGTNWTTYDPSGSGIPGNSIAALAVDHHGNKWVGPYSGGVSKFDGVNWSKKYVLSGPGYSDDAAYSMIADQTDKIWMGGIDGDVYKYDGTNWVTYNNTEDLWSINSIAVDSQNDKWFCTHDGLFKFDEANWVVYDSANSGLPNYEFSSIAVDLQGNEWLGSYGAGVYKFNGYSSIKYDSANSGLINDYVNVVKLDDHGNRWFGTANGVSKFDGTNWTSYDTLNSGLPGNYINAIAIDKAGNKWFSTYSSTKYLSEGVTKFDDTTWTTYTTFNSGLSDNTVYSIVVDNLNNKWFGTDLGLSELISTDSIFSVWLQFNEDICLSDTITLNPVINFGKKPYTFSWQTNGDTLSCTNCQHPSSIITQNSIFTVSVTDGNNNTVTDTLYVYTCNSPGINSISKIDPQNSLLVYPNPAADNVFLQLDIQKANNFSIVVQNLQGQQVLPENNVGWLNAGSHKLDLNTASLSSGFYLVGCKTADGVIYQKLILQK